ncbi:MAG: YbaN family protein [Rhizobacter sp.]
MTQEPDSPPPSLLRPAWARHLWLIAGWSAMLLGFVGLFLPLLPTAPFVLVAAFCFSNGSPRWERWLLTHPHFGPVTREWREHRAVPPGQRAAGPPVDAAPRVRLRRAVGPRPARRRRRS